MRNIENSTIPRNRIDEILARYDIAASTSPSALWSSAWKAQKQKLWKAFFQKQLKRLRRKNSTNGQEEILSAYSAQWQKKAFSRYEPKASTGGAPWEWGDLKWTISNEGGAAIRLIYLEEVLRNLNPTSVLEVGAGNGINLLMLASRFPEIRFTGVEPTEGGFLTAQAAIQEGVLPESLVQFAPFSIHSPASVASIRMVQESAQKLSFPEASMDVVMTSLALEQMEQIRHEALTEIARVAKDWVVMLEPFKEVNSKGLKRLYVDTYDYFQGAISELKDYGMQVEKIYFDMPHKSILGTALVIARRIR
jgi:ubiquinone/menaquinone biosynthesis C-methylase UbiE